jgi:hypothetical protein
MGDTCLSRVSATSVTRIENLPSCAAHLKGSIENLPFGFRRWETAAGQLYRVAGRTERVAYTSSARDTRRTHRDGFVLAQVPGIAGTPIPQPKQKIDQTSLVLKKGIVHPVSSSCHYRLSWSFMLTPASVEPPERSVAFSAMPLWRRGKWTSECARALPTVLHLNLDQSTEERYPFL